MKKTFLINAVALRSAGPLTILKLLVEELNYFSHEVRIKLLLDSDNFHYVSQALSNSSVKSVFLEWPNRSWLHKLFFEYAWIYFYTCRSCVDVYLSMGDVNSLVCAAKRATYCHNPSPFYKAGLRDFLFSPSVFAYYAFAKYIIRFNSKGCTSIAQTHWIAQKLKDTYTNVVVCPPSISEAILHSVSCSDSDLLDAYTDSQAPLLIYPCAPRVHKYIEYAIDVFIEANFAKAKLFLTLNGHENRYSAWLYEKYKRYDNVLFSRFLDRNELTFLFERAAAMLFTSKLETFGLPLVEFAQYGKPIFTLDLPYAKEVLCGYDLHFLLDNYSVSRSALMLRRVLSENSTLPTDDAQLQYTHKSNSLLLGTQRMNLMGVVDSL